MKRGKFVTVILIIILIFSVPFSITGCHMPASYKGGLTFHQIEHIAVGGDGKVWCSVADSKGVIGLGCYDGADWNIYTTNDGLPNNYVDDIVTDKNGKVWFNFGNVVGQFDGSQWIPMKANSGPYSGISDIISRDTEGNIWLINTDGISWYDGVNWHIYASLESLPVNYKFIVRDARGDVWLAGETDLWRFDGSSWQSYLKELNGQMIFSINMDNQGNLLVCAYKSYLYGDTIGNVTRDYMKYSGKVMRFDGTTWSSFFTGSFEIRSIYQDKAGNFWCCTNEGLQVYNGASWRTLTTADGLVSNQVFAIAEDNGGFWIGTNLGVSYYDNNAGK